MQEFNGRNFAPVEYRDAKGEKRDCYAMTRQGFNMHNFVQMPYTEFNLRNFAEVGAITERNFALSKKFRLRKIFSKKYLTNQKFCAIIVV